jgi:hypothetical protein
MKINWEVFFENTSTTEALVLFVRGNYTFSDFERDCWTHACKKAIRELARRGYGRAHKQAKRALRIRGYVWNKP